MNTIKFLSVEVCRTNPGTIFVFGDNLIHRGKAGQAIIRDEPNAFGIPTKRLPSMGEVSFFADRDDEFKAVFTAIDKLMIIGWERKVVFPEAGIGTGLAKMEEYSPILFKRMNVLLNTYF